MPNPFPRPKDQQTEPYWNTLNEVIDPEMGIGIVDLGLIYDLEANDKGAIKVTMTLTSMACPVGPQILSQVETVMLTHPEITRVYIDLVWEPAWNKDRIDSSLAEMMWGL